MIQRVLVVVLVVAAMLLVTLGLAALETYREDLRAWVRR